MHHVTKRIAGPLLWMLVLMAALSGCGPTPTDSDGSTAAAGPGDARLRAYNAAFNSHDVDAMLSMVSQDIEWLSVEGTTMVLEAEGAAALRKSMNEYFSVVENPQSELSGFVSQGNFIAVRETATWGLEGARKSQSSLAVYEIVDDKVRRVWYYPVQ